MGHPGEEGDEMTARSPYTIIMSTNFQKSSKARILFRRGEKRLTHNPAEPVLVLAAERRRMVARGEAQAKGQAKPLEPTMKQNQAPEGRRKPRGRRFPSPLRGLGFLLVRSRGCASLHPWLPSDAAPRLKT